MARTWFKPAGLPVFPPHGVPDGPCVLSDVLSAHADRREIPWPEGFAGGIAHRLDVSTSGALWIADTPDELVEMRQAFAQRTLTKVYRFRAAKDVPWNSHQIERAIAHDKRRKRRMVVQRGPNTPHRGRWHPARTTFERLNGRLWKATMRSGVMHQIRVHAAFLGIPLQGDPIYGGGARADDAPDGATFLLHHVGLSGGGLRTTPVPMPPWAVDRKSR